MTKKDYDIKLVTKWECPKEGEDLRALISMPNIPKPCHGKGMQPRTIFGPKSWNNMRKHCYELANDTCVICGTRPENLRQRHCHEAFDIDYEKGTATFVRVFCVCQTCVDEGTDVLTTDGWKKIPEVTTKDKVACWDKDGTIAFLHPTDTIVSHKKTAIEIIGHGSKLIFSEDHRLPLKVASSQSPSYGRVKDVLAGEYKASHYYNWLIGGENHKEEHLTPRERVYIAIEADGHIMYDKEKPRGEERQRAYSNRYNSKEYRYTYRIHLVKTRKIERFKMLIEQSGLKYKITKETSDSYCDFVVWENKDLKHFSECFDINMGHEKALEFIEELVFWDGTYAQGVTTWFTNKPEEVDFVQGVAAQCNIRTNVQVVNRIGNLRKGPWQTPYERLSYSVNFRSVTPELCAREMKPKKIKWDKPMYCITVPTSYFIARRDGTVFVTGNCHIFGIHTGRASTLHKSGNPLCPKEALIAGAENAFRIAYEYNKDHPEADLRLYSTWLDYLKQDDLREEMEGLIEKYQVKFYEEDKKKMAKWGDWKVVIFGKEYPTPYKDEKEWKTAMEAANLTDTARVYATKKKKFEGLDSVEITEADLKKIEQAEVPEGF